MLLAVALHALLITLREQASGADPDYAETVKRVYQDALTWVRDGLGVGKEVWCTDTKRSMICDRGAGRFSTDELNRVRVELSRKFALAEKLGPLSGKPGGLARGQLASDL